MREDGYFPFNNNYILVLREVEDEITDTRCIIEQYVKCEHGYEFLTCDRCRSCGKIVLFRDPKYVEKESKLKCTCPECGSLQDYTGSLLMCPNCRSVIDPHAEEKMIYEDGAVFYICPFCREEVIEW